ncbi:hypothetical protein R6Q57_007910 [Mikania cordata]
MPSKLKHCKMAQFVLFVLILTHSFLTPLARCSGIEPSSVVTPDFSLLNDRNTQIAEAPKSRKLGKHHVSKSESPDIVPTSDHEENGASVAEEDGMYLEMNHHHHGSSSVDKSIAGGGVILGGLVHGVCGVDCCATFEPPDEESMVEPPTPITGYKCFIIKYHDTYCYSYLKFN